MRHCDFFHFHNGSPPRVLQSVNEAASAKDSGGFVWLNFCMPDRSDLEAVIPAFSIHHLSVEDCFDEDQIPKIDIFEEYTSILFNDLSWKEGAASIAELNLFLGKDFIITVIRDETWSHSPTAAVIESLERAGNRAIPGPARVLHAILDRVVDRKFPAVDASVDAVANLEDRLLSGTGNVTPEEIQTVRRDLMLMRKSLFHERETFERICRKDSAFIPGKSLIYFSDIHDHLSKFADTVESCRETMTNLAQMQLALTNNEMVVAANRTNNSVSRLTFITTIFMPLTLVAGIGGMSEWTMITGPENWKYSYPVLFAAMAVLGVINYLVLRWMNRK